MSRIIRVINAAIDETIEIRWWRRIRPIEQPSEAGSPDPPKDRLTQILIDRHTAPPTAVWDARTKEPDPPHD